MLLFLCFLKCSISVGDEGDPCYLAPETMRSQFTKACDVFSLGVTLLELATDLDLPKNGQLWQELRNKGPDPRVTQHLTPELRRVIQLMMTQDPQRRPGVKQLLELPSVKLAVKRRARQLLISRVRDSCLWLLMLLVPLLSFLLNLASSIFQPLLQMLDRLPQPPPSTPSPHKLSSLGSPLQMDCFSDDETDITVSSSPSSSLAAPLDSSRSTPHVSFFSPDVSRDPVIGAEDFSESFTCSPGSLRKRTPASSPFRLRAKFSSRTPGISPGTFSV